MHHKPSVSTLAAALLAALGTAPMAAQAATIGVVSPDDGNVLTASTCTLRQAIVSMNTGALQGNCANSSSAAFGSNDTIIFARSALAGATGGTITLADSADSSGNLGGTLVVSDSSLTIDGSEWLGSSAGRYGGGVTIARPVGATNAFGILADMTTGASLTLSGLTISNGLNSSGMGSGGGVRSTYGINLTLSHTTVTGNAATRYGGGIYDHCYPKPRQCTIAINDSTVSNNYAVKGGGIYVVGQIAFTVSNSTLSDNSAKLIGGALFVGGFVTLEMKHSTVSNNTAGITIDGNNFNFGEHLGGGIYTHGLSVATTLIDSTLSGNIAMSHNDGTYHGTGIQQGAGGGILAVGPLLTLINCTLTNNIAYRGGGILWDEPATVTNSTFSHNVAAFGGGVYAGNGKIVSSTFSKNTALGLPKKGTFSNGADIGFHWDYQSPQPIDIRMMNTITTSGCVFPFFGNNDLGGNIDTTQSCIISSSTTSIGGPVALNLGPLQDNGGPTQTMLPGFGSAAINAISCANAPPTDQRGMIRPDPGSAGLAKPCDVGAVEVGSISDEIFKDGFGN